MKLNLENEYEAITASGDIAKLSLKTLLSFSEKTLLYFYPKDDTPGCTTENKDFSCLKNQFTKLGITLIGVSRDSLETHLHFIEKHDLGVDLISDPDFVLHKELGAYGEKNNYGKIVTGVIRSSFLLDSGGHVLKPWKGIKATGHAGRVLEELS